LPLRLMRWNYSTRHVSTSTVPPPRKQPSALPRIIGFSAFTITLGAAAGAYTLMIDEPTLFWARDKFPRLINTIAPILGLPQEAPRGELVFEDDDEEQGPTDIKQVVGDVVHVAVKLASGRVMLLECNAHETPASVAQLALQGKEKDRVLDVSVLDPAKAKELSALSPDELENKMNNLKIPEIPSVVTLYSLGVALELCRQTEIDFEVRLRLAQNEADKLSLKRGLDEITERKKTLKQMIKEEKKRQNVGMLASFFRRY
jgi:hypothetical protein